jgi:uncharacterized SAM-binding protein YcdF (DUF218 family)
LIVDLLKQYGRLSSPVFVVCMLLVVWLWMWSRTGTRGPRRLLAGFLALYWLLATPIGAGALVATVASGFSQIQTREDAKGADAVVVLGGGANSYRQGDAVLGLLTAGSLLRALETARVAKLIDARLVLVSGGIPTAATQQLKPESDMLRDALVTVGVPADRIVQDPEARTTYDHPRTLAPILKRYGIGRFVLVTSPMHMRRAVRLFRAAGLDPVPSPALLRPDNRRPPPWFMPTEDSLSISDQVLYEYVAWPYYWWNGWL